MQSSSVYMLYFNENVTRYTQNASQKVPCVLDRFISKYCLRSIYYMYVLRYMFLRFYYVPDYHKCCQKANLISVMTHFLIIIFVFVIITVTASSGNCNCSFVVWRLVHDCHLVATTAGGESYCTCTLQSGSRAKGNVKHFSFLFSKCDNLLTHVVTLRLYVKTF